MWKSVAGHGVSMKVAAETDDWETDPDFENDVSEQEQRWGAKTVEGSGRMAPISVAELRETVSQEHQRGKERELAQAPKASYGYGGKFGVEKDRMDKGAMGHDFVAQVEQHSSQTDAAHGFGGKFGVQKDRGGQDYSKGFGGRYGVQTDRIDKVLSLKAVFCIIWKILQSASSFTDMEEPSSAYTKTQPVEASSAGAGKLKARFENMAKASGEENKRRKEREREEQEGKEHEEERQRLEQKAREENAREEEEEERAREETERREQQLDDEADYEDIEAPPPAPDEADYEELTCSLTAKALYSYQEEADDEITFDVDDIITNIEMVDEGWWKGQCGGRSGLFPASYVQMLP
ncbi:hypothetical protein CRUP_017737 [Coryphaenoides rupestris]|nr:hypothetical protein CRUP_017737 [Coryphaenoides rupestris]